MNRKDIVMQIQMLMRRLFPSAEVILYGSEARNEARPDSDKTRKSVLKMHLFRKKLYFCSVNPARMRYTEA